MSVDKQRLSINCSIELDYSLIYVFFSIMDLLFKILILCVTSRTSGDWSNISTSQVDFELTLPPHSNAVPNCMPLRWTRDAVEEMRTLREKNWKMAMK